MGFNMNVLDVSHEALKRHGSRIVSPLETGEGEVVCCHRSTVIKRNILEIFRDLLRGDLAKSLIQRTVQNEADGSVFGTVV